MELGGIIYRKPNCVVSGSLALVYKGDLELKGRVPVFVDDFCMVSVKEGDPLYDSALKAYQRVRESVVESNGSVKKFNAGEERLPEGFEESIGELFRVITGSDLGVPVRFVSDTLPWRDSILEKSLVCILAEESGLYNNGHSNKLECAFSPFRFYA